MKKYLEAAKIVSVHGVHGEVNAQVWCDTPEVLCRLKRLYSKSGDTAFDIIRARPKSDTMAVLKIKGIDTPETAQKLRNTVLYADRDDFSLPEGSYFIQDLLGLECRAEDGEILGKVSDVMETGANDVYEITKDDKKYYIPAIPSVILNVDISSGIMTVYKMEGLFDEN